MRRRFYSDEKRKKRLKTGGKTATTQKVNMTVAHIKHNTRLKCVCVCVSAWEGGAYIKSNKL